MVSTPRYKLADSIAIDPVSVHSDIEKKAITDYAQIDILEEYKNAV